MNGGITALNKTIERHLDRVKGLRAEGTYNKRTSDLRDFNEWLEAEGYDDPTDLDHRDLESYFFEIMGRGYSEATLGTRYQSVKGFYDYLAGWAEEIEESPFEQMTRSDYVNSRNGKSKHDSDTIVYVTKDEVDQLAENVPSPTLRNELLIRLMFQTGVRQGEIVRIDVGDIDMESQSISIYANKTDSRRVVFYQPSLDFLMDQWIEGGHRSGVPRANESDRLFISPYGPLKERRVAEVVNESAENAGIQEALFTDAGGRDRKRITSHALRHGHAVYALKSGIDVRTIQLHLGHQNIETTMRYLDLIDTDVRDSYHRFGSIE